MRRVTSISVPVAHLAGPGKLKVVNGRLAFATGKLVPLRLDPAALQIIYCYGPVGVTDEAVQMLFRHQVELSWLSPTGQKCRGRLSAIDATPAALRRRQHVCFADPAWARGWAARLVAAKIDSQQRAARHFQRHGTPDTNGILVSLEELGHKAQQAPELQHLRGLEGAAAAAWFGFYAQLFVSPWQFPGRVRRPPTDPVNALLSLGYTLLLSRTQARCESRGLETTLGVLHEYRSGRPSLVCDMMEPLRVPAVDRWAVRLCRRDVLQPDQFSMTPEPRWQPSAFGQIIQSWEDHWLNDGHDDALIQLVEELCRRINAAVPISEGES